MATPSELRGRIRKNTFNSMTSGECPGYVQCNIVILPSDAASDFLHFCQLNPKPCPLIAMSAPGSHQLPSLGGGIDIRTDVPAYRVFKHGKLVGEVTDIRELWRDDLVTFALGCSFSFEEALIEDGLEVRNISEAVNVPMYRTDIKCSSAGPFKENNMVVSMRPFSAPDAIRAIQISTRFPQVHGAPIHIGDPSFIGISNIEKPDFSESVSIKERELPVFWACGVTPQVALENAKLPFAITHSPGCMLVSDVRNSKLAIL